MCLNIRSIWMNEFDRMSWEFVHVRKALACQEGYEFYVIQVKPSEWVSLILEFGSVGVCENSRLSNQDNITG